jgi:adenylate kinase
MKIFLGGVNGVGKTTLIAKIKEAKPSLIVVDGSKAFMDWLGFRDDYEKLRAMDNETANQKLTEFITELVEKYELMDFILSSHYLNMVRGEVKDVMMGDWPNHFDQFILLTADPAQIYRRINNDSRDRALVSYETENEMIQAVKLYMDQTLEHAQAKTAQYQKPLKIITNNDGDLDKAALEVLDLLKE